MAETHLNEFATVGGERQREQLAKFFQQQMELLAPLLGQLATGATIQGNRLQAQLGVTLGNAGIGGSSGVGALLRGIGGTFAAQSVGEARLKSALQALASSSELSTGILGNFAQIRSAELAKRGGDSWFDRLVNAGSSVAGVFASAP